MHLLVIFSFCKKNDTNEQMPFEYKKITINSEKFYIDLSAIQLSFYIVWIVCMEFT
jgi:hypothetical protein